MLFGLVHRRSISLSCVITDAGGGLSCLLCSHLRGVAIELSALKIVCLFVKLYLYLSNYTYRSSNKASCCKKKQTGKSLKIAQTKISARRYCNKCVFCNILEFAPKMYRFKELKLQWINCAQYTELAISTAFVHTSYL